MNEQRDELVANLKSQSGHLGRALLFSLPIFLTWITGQSKQFWPWLIGAGVPWLFVSLVRDERRLRRLVREGIEARFGCDPVSLPFVNSVPGQEDGVGKSDVGYLSTDRSGLNFYGYASSWSLAWSQIKSLRVAQLESRVRVTWVNEDGEDQLLLLSPRESLWGVRAERDRIRAAAGGASIPFDVPRPQALPTQGFDNK